MFFVALLCACAAHSSYDASDVDMQMQGSYGDGLGRRLTGSAGGDSATGSFPNAQCHANFMQRCFCNDTKGKDQSITESCEDIAFACTCTQCCQAANIASKYANFVRPADAPECNTLDPVLPTDGVTDCTFPLPVPTTNTFRYQGITPLGCGLSFAWYYRDTDDNSETSNITISVTFNDTVGFHANPQGLYSALIEENAGEEDSTTLSFQRHTPYGGYELYADDTQSFTSVSMLFADKPQSSNNVRSTLSSVPVGLQIDDTAKLPLSASSPFWADQWYNETAGAPQRCVMLGHGCSGTAKLWRLCRLGGYGQADASVRVTLLHKQAGAAPGSPAAATTAAPAAASSSNTTTNASDSSDGLSGVAIAGIIVGGLTLGSALLLCLYLSFCEGQPTGHF